MRWTSALAIYVLFWAFSVFFVLPFEARAKCASDDTPVPGQMNGAPAQFRPGRVVRRVTIVATVLFGLFYLNYVEGWITADMLDWTR